MREEGTFLQKTVQLFQTARLDALEQSESLYSECNRSWGHIKGDTKSLFLKTLELEFYILSAGMCFSPWWLPENEAGLIKASQLAFEVFEVTTGAESSFVLMHSDYIYHKFITGPDWSEPDEMLYAWNLIKYN